MSANPRSLPPPPSNALEDLLEVLTEVDPRGDAAILVRYLDVQKEFTLLTALTEARDVLSMARAIAHELSARNTHNVPSDSGELPKALLRLAAQHRQGKERPLTPFQIGQRLLALEDALARPSAQDGNPIQYPLM